MISTHGGCQTFVNGTIANGLGRNVVAGLAALLMVSESMYVCRSLLREESTGGLSIRTDGGQTFTNQTVANANLPTNNVKFVFISEDGQLVYVGLYLGEL